MQVHAPVPSAATEHTSAAPSNTLTIAKGSAVPVSIGEGATDAPMVGVEMMGSTGAWVSMVKVRCGETPEALSAASVARAVTTTTPGNSTDEVQAHWPEVGTTVLHSSTPAAADPHRAARLAAAGEGGGGGVAEASSRPGRRWRAWWASTVSFTVLRVSVPVPVTLVCEAVSTMAGPSTSAEALTEAEKRPVVQLVVTCTVPTRTVTTPARWCSCPPPPPR